MTGASNLDLVACLVVVSWYQCVQPAPDNCPQLFDAVEVRRLPVLFSLVVDLVAIDEYLKYSANTGLDLDCYVLTTFCHELVDHPGRNSVILSRNAVDDLDVHSAFASHPTPPVEFSVQVIIYEDIKVSYVMNQ